jgi:hypothetical protein
MGHRTGNALKADASAVRMICPFVKYKVLEKLLAKAMPAAWDADSSNRTRSRDSLPSR